jgi:hypothetical protein
MRTWPGVKRPGAHKLNLPFATNGCIEAVTNRAVPSLPDFLFRVHNFFSRSLALQTLLYL